MNSPQAAVLTVSALVLLNIEAIGQTAVSIVPSEISLSAPASSPGSPSSAARTIVTVTTRGQSVPFTASVRSLNPVGGWLSVSPGSGTAPATLTVSADPTGLSPGTYLGQVVVSANGTAAVANVLFAVGSSGSLSTGSFVVDPTGLVFVGDTMSQSLPVQTLTIMTPRTAAGSIAFRAVATSAGNWLSVPPFTMTTPATLQVNASQTGLVPGNYEGSITLAPLSGGNPTVVPVRLFVPPNTSISTLTLSQTALTFHQQTSSSAPPLQIVSVNTTGGSREFSATTAAKWLRFTSTFNPVATTSLTDNTPSDLTVQIDPAGLAAGTYEGSILITAANLPPQEIPVTLTVSNITSVNAVPSSVILSDSTTEATIIVAGTGSTGVNYTASVSSSSPWLSVSPMSGSTSVVEMSRFVNIKANTAGLAGGTYNGSVTLAVPSTGATLTVPVRLTVSGSGGVTTSLILLPDTLQLAGIAGVTNASQSVDVLSNIFGVQHSFAATATSSGGWLNVTPFAASAPAKLVVTADANAVPGPGTYQGTVLLTSLLTGTQSRIPVSYTLAGQGFAADPASLTFSQQTRGTNPPSQLVRLTSNTPTSFALDNAPEWLRVEPRNGTTPATINVWVETSLLPPGSNSGTIRIAGPSSQISIPVSASVLAPPVPVASPASVNLAYNVGAPPASIPSQAIDITSSTGDAVSFTVGVTTESGLGWLTVVPDSGSTPTKLTIGLNTALLAPGTQKGTVRITQTGASSPAVTIPVTVTVNAPGVVPQTVLNSATLAPTLVVPGQLITITGTGLGPTAGVSARPTAAGAIETRLADTIVSFDGVPAPLLFVRNDQINAIVPYAIFGRATTRLQIQQGSGYSIPLELKVVDAAPGVFTGGVGGGGPAVALNADLTINSLANPAARGSVISVFGTGEGQTDPPGQDGRIILTDLRRPRLPVAAFIGGQEAEVLYFGSAPSTVSGVFQANIRVPTSIQAGSQKIEIQVGTAASQSGATISVR